MELKTSVNIEKATKLITYSDAVLFIGSCFASEIGSKMAEGKMPVLINPAGTVYNPVSVKNTLDSIISGRLFDRGDLYCYEGTWLSFSHYTEFNSSEPEEVVSKINSSIGISNNFIKNARFLFITFGTASVFRLIENDSIVSNCHKLPSSFFRRDMLRVNDIVEMWYSQLDRLKEVYPDLKVIFTISPVRHWRDGAHGNQVSKSVLFVAVEELLRHPSSPGYFPAYEIFMDELRDYRYSAEDMLHPSKLAVDYIWEIFSQNYLDNQALSLWKEASGIAKATGHRITSGNLAGIRKFAEGMLLRISKIESTNASLNLDFTAEKEHFIKLKST